jgi:phenylalanyl-tRNA synthetase alpha chain
LKDLFAEFKIPNDQKEFDNMNLLKPLPVQTKEALESKEESKGFYGDLTRSATRYWFSSPFHWLKPNHRHFHHSFNVSEGPKLKMIGILIRIKLARIPSGA